MIDWKSHRYSLMSLIVLCFITGQAMVIAHDLEADHHEDHDHECSACVLSTRGDDDALSVIFSADDLADPGFDIWVTVLNSHFVPLAWLGSSVSFQESLNRVFPIAASVQLSRAPPLR